VPVPDAPLPFAGFPPEAFSWFAGLEADNSRAWFAAHRPTYDDAVRGPLEAMLDELADALGGDVRVFRQQRDVRFSPDKSPYKTRTYGIIVPASGGEAARYAELSAAGLFAGTGYYELARTSSPASARPWRARRPGRSSRPPSRGCAPQGSRPSARR
jgi:uncharacterized protein (TIGR02453 family)